MRRRPAHLASIVTAGLVALAAACPASTPALDDLAFACLRVEDCALGYSCAQGRCVRVGAADAAIALDAGVQDRAAPPDAPGADRTPVDGPGSDRGPADAGGLDGDSLDRSGRDLRVDDGASVDAGATDAAVADHGADAAARDAPAEDRPALDVDEPDARALDAAIPDAPVPDVALPDTAVIDAGCAQAGLWFDGIDDRIVVATAPDLGGARRLTVEAWIQPTSLDLSPGTRAVIASHHDEAARAGYELRLRDGWLEFIVDVSANARPCSTWAAYDDGRRLRPGRWVHVAGVLDAVSDTESRLDIFVDGQRQRSESEPAITVVGAATTLQLGAPAARSGDRFAGVLDQVRLSGSARYTADFARPQTPLDVDGDTLALWRLDEGSGQRAHDLAPGARHGTLGLDDQAAADDPVWVPVTCVVDRPAPGSVDAGTEDAGPSPASCDTTYGAAGDYTLCEQTATTCEIAVSTGGSNCAALCQSFGGVCVDAFDNVAGCERRAFMGDTCDTNRGSEICVCTRP